MKIAQFRMARPTNQLSRLTDFYTRVIGLPLIGRFTGHDGYDGVMIGLPGANQHLEFTQHSVPVALPAPTAEHLLVFYFETPEAYQEAVLRMKDEGLHPVAPENPYWLGKSETFEDPDGWRIVLYNGLFMQD